MLYCCLFISVHMPCTIALYGVFLCEFALKQMFLFAGGGDKVRLQREHRHTTRHQHRRQLHGARAQEHAVVAAL